jgi:hypothetical protein
MNALVPHTERRGVEKALADAEAKFLAPVARRPWREDAFRQVLTLAEPLFRAAATPAAVDRANQVMAIAPTSNQLEAYRGALVSATSLETPDERANRALIGMLLDAFPHSRPPNLAAYAGSMLHDITREGFSPAVVVRACQDLRTTLKYPPSIAEMLEACREARQAMLNTLGVAERMHPLVARAEELLRLPATERAA